MTLQENNAITTIDLKTKLITDLPIGFKEYSKAANAFDPSDKDGKVEFRTGAVTGMYLGDAISSFISEGSEYIITANEGDSRDYNGFGEEKESRILILTLLFFLMQLL